MWRNIFLEFTDCLDKYGIIHERSLEFYPEKNKFIGIDKIIKNKDFIMKKIKILPLQIRILPLRNEDQILRF